MGSSVSEGSICIMGSKVTLAGIEPVARGAKGGAIGFAGGDATGLAGAAIEGEANGVLTGDLTWGVTLPGLAGALSGATKSISSRESSMFNVF